MTIDLKELIKKEGWSVVNVEGVNKIKVYEQLLTYTHPLQIHLYLYRTETNPDTRYFHMKSAHDYLWSKTEWHYWTERRFRRHCGSYKYLGWAGGASASKSYDAAKIGILFWLANPKKRGVVVASTTLESLGARVWGYVTDFLSSMEVKVPFTYLGGNSPKVLYPKSEDGDDIRGTRAGMFAVAAGQGDGDTAIRNTIGRHPDDALLVILDECSELNIEIARGFPNLDSSEKPFQVIGIANSASQDDLHGALCTPKNGWDTVDPHNDIEWETTRKDGLCLFFSCYESPAVHEQDEAKRKRLSKFLISEVQIKEKEEILGKDSDLFYRFVLGFWRNSSTDKKILSKDFLGTYNLKEQAEWLGINPLMKIAGLDPAFSTGGDKCLLQIGIMGQTVAGNVVLDFKEKALRFEIKIRASKKHETGVSKSAELQIAEEVCDILIKQGVPLSRLIIDANGQGRAIGGSIYLKMLSLRGDLSEPLKLYTVRGGSVVTNSFGMIIKTPIELYDEFRKYIERLQIKGLDEIALAQIANRAVVQDPKTLKRRLETKAEFRARIGAAIPSLAHSPDEADAVVLCHQAAIYHGFSLGQVMAIPKVESFAHEKLLEYRAQNKVTMAEQEAFILKADFSGSISDQLKYQKPFGGL